MIELSMRRRRPQQAWPATDDRLTGGSHLRVSPSFVENAQGWLEQLLAPKARTEFSLPRLEMTGGQQVGPNDELRSYLINTSLCLLECRLNCGRSLHKMCNAIAEHRNLVDRREARRRREAAARARAEAEAEAYADEQAMLGHPFFPHPLDMLDWDTSHNSQQSHDSHHLSPHDGFFPHGSAEGATGPGSHSAALPGFSSHPSSPHSSSSPHHAALVQSKLMLPSSGGGKDRRGSPPPPPKDPGNRGMGGMKKKKGPPKGTLPVSNEQAKLTTQRMQRMLMACPRAEPPPPRAPQRPPPSPLPPPPVPPTPPVPHIATLRTLLHAPAALFGGGGSDSNVDEGKTNGDGKKDGTTEGGGNGKNDGASKLTQSDDGLPTDPSQQCPSVHVGSSPPSERMFPPLSPQPTSSPAQLRKTRAVFLSKPNDNSVNANANANANADPSLLGTADLLLRAEDGVVLRRTDCIFEETLLETRVAVSDSLSPLTRAYKELLRDYRQLLDHEHRVRSVSATRLQPELRRLHDSTEQRRRMWGMLCFGAASATSFRNIVAEAKRAKIMRAHYEVSEWGKRTYL